jgi:hypothetical protein
MILLFVCLPLGVALHLGAAFAGWWWRQPANQTCATGSVCAFP